ncbi:MAG: DUF6519 domain-containing protein [Myxococcota bacterium]
MKGDFSRGHAPDRKRGETYRRVLLQQGRVLLDSDIAASVDAQDRLLRDLGRDLGCTMGSPDLGYVVTPGPLFALFETVEQVSGLPVAGDPFRAYRDHGSKIYSRYPALLIDATDAAGQVQIEGRWDLSVADHPTLRIWARIPVGVSLQGQLDGQAITVGPGLGEASFEAYDIDVSLLGLTTYGRLTLGFSASAPNHEAWIGLIEGVSPLTPPSAFWFTAGRFYLDGLAVEQAPKDGLHPASTYADPDPNAPPLPSPAVNDYVVAYLEGWERVVTRTEDPGILEQALGGAIDTTLRTRAVGQVKLATVTAGSGATVDDIIAQVPPSFLAIDRGQGRLDVTTTPSGTDPDPCAIPVQGGYTGSENRLYRFEVHVGGDIGTAIFKWSRDNGGSLGAINIDDAANGLVTVVGGLSILDGELVEVLHEGTDLGDQDRASVDLGPVSVTPTRNRVGTLYYATTTARTGQIQLLDLVTKTPVSLTTVATATGLKVRRWSGTCDTTLNGGTSSFELGDGITIDLSGSDFRPRDYWQYEARPQRDNANGPWQDTPHGPERLLTPLALLRRTQATGPLTLLHWFEHQFSSLCELEADDIAYDGDKAGTDATTVQEAIDELYTKEPLVVNGCGELIVHPDSDLQAVFDSIPDGADARICIHPGTWTVGKTVLVQNKGHLMIGGAGRASLIASENLSRVLRFERCASVHMHDVSVTASKRAQEGMGITGAVSVIDCPDVTLERLIVSTGAGPGPRRRVSAIQVATLDPDAASGRVKIRDCDVTAGHAQVGILVVDADAADIENNDVTCPQQSWSLAGHLDDSYVLGWAGSLMMSHLGVFDEDRFSNDIFLASTTVRLTASQLDEARLAPVPGRTMIVTGLGEWTSPGRVTGFMVHDDLVEASLWDTLLEANPMTGWNNTDGGGRRVAHQEGWVLSNLRKLRRGIVRAALGQNSGVDLGASAAMFGALANQLVQRTNVTAGDQGIVVGGRRTPSLGDAFAPKRTKWNTLYVQDPRAPQATIRGNRVDGFVQGIHIGTSYNQDLDQREQRMRSYRARVHDNVVKLRVPGIARERHGIFVGNAHSAYVTDNTVELTYPAINRWNQQDPTDGIRLWGSYGPLVHVTGNHVVGVPTGVRFNALNPHIGTNPHASWRFEHNAYAGFGGPLVSNAP